jgi:transforming growth factor-beta-induced protein
MRRLSILGIVTALAMALALPLVSPAEASGDSIADIAASNEDFSTLVAALQAAGLDAALAEGGPYTVFAPTNDAFAAALDLLGISAADLLADTDLLTSILLYHVVAGEVTSDQVVGLDSAETLNGAMIHIGAGPTGVQLNGAANVIATDIQASNGVIHVIDGVIFPPANILALARNNGLSIFEQALQAADLYDTVLTGGPYTILAPTDAAFVAALDALDLTADELFADTDLLTSVLLYHVIPGSVTSDVVVTLDSAPTLNGASISINGTSFNGGQANVFLPDLIGSNGVLHIIDGVLLPPSN